MLLIAEPIATGLGTRAPHEIETPNLHMFPTFHFWNNFRNSSQRHIQAAEAAEAVETTQGNNVPFEPTDPAALRQTGVGYPSRDGATASATGALALH